MFVSDWSEWPLVTLHFRGSFDAAGEEEYLAALQRLAEATEPYVVILVTEGDEHLSHPAKVRNNLIFKKHRGDFVRHCRHMFRVKPDTPFAEIDDAKLKKAMPFPASHAPDLAEARRQAFESLARAILRGDA